MRELTKGQKQVGCGFNPSSLIAVDLIKEKAAELLDLIAEECGSTRESSIAATHIETASMFAVKAVILKHAD